LILRVICVDLAVGWRRDVRRRWTQTNGGQVPIALAQDRCRNKSPRVLVSDAWDAVASRRQGGVITALEGVRAGSERLNRRNPERHRRSSRDSPNLQTRIALHRPGRQICPVLDPNLTTAQLTRRAIEQRLPPGKHLRPPWQRVYILLLAKPRAHLQGIPHTMNRGEALAWLEDGDPDLVEGVVAKNLRLRWRGANGCTSTSSVAAQSRL